MIRQTRVWERGRPLPDLSPYERELIRRLESRSFRRQRIMKREKRGNRTSLKRQHVPDDRKNNFKEVRNN